MNIVAFVFSLVLFIGGLLLMGYAFETTGYELAMFAGGILVVSAAVALPVHVLKRIDR